MTNPDLYFKQLEIGPMANFVYLIGDPATKEAAVVDPAWNVDEILRRSKEDGYVIKHILVTHGHPDHINGVEEMINKTNAHLHMHKSEVPWMKGWDETVINRETGDHLKMGNLDITFIHTPGHTPGSQCFLINNRLVSGDTLFINGCGRTDFPGGNAEQLYDSLTNKLSKLDDHVVLFPGHNYADIPFDTMGAQKKTNPYLQRETVKNFIRTRQPGLLTDED